MSKERCIHCRLKNKPSQQLSRSVPPPPPPGAPPPFRILTKIGPHFRLQDSKCSRIDMPPPRKSGAPPSAPQKKKKKKKKKKNGSYSYATDYNFKLRN